jgi:predicted  nucleic acid-binding Zn-ribbon protein
MLQEIEQLLVLQDRDRRIRLLKTELKNAPLEKKELEAKLNAAKTGADTAKQKMRDLEVEKKRLEVEAQGKRDSIGKFKTQQMQTRKNEEYQALANEITHFNKEIQKIEDRELEVMEGMEQQKPVVAEAEAHAMEAQKRVATQISDLEVKVKAVQENLAKLESDRAVLAKEVDEDLLEVYNRLFTSKGGDAVVPLEHEVCMGCHMKLTTQTFVRVKAGRQITHCEQCGRILYFSE